MPVVTYQANIFDKDLFENNKNIVCANDKDGIILSLRKILTNDHFRSYISKNSFEIYKNKININKTINNNSKLIESFI